MEVHLRAARIPFIGHVAHHYWLVTTDGGRVDRWEVWQRRDQGGESWGHLHKNLMAHDQGVGNGPSWVVRTWLDAEAATLAERLALAPEAYPYRHRYLPWPGPNSNTFVGWALGDLSDLGWEALGKRYPVWRPRPRGSDRGPRRSPRGWSAD